MGNLPIFFIVSLTVSMIKVDGGDRGEWGHDWRLDVGRGQQAHAHAQLRVPHGGDELSLAQPQISEDECRRIQLQRLDDDQRLFQERQEREEYLMSVANKRSGPGESSSSAAAKKPRFSSPPQLSLNIHDTHHYGSFRPSHPPANPPAPANPPRIFGVSLVPSRAVTSGRHSFITVQLNPVTNYTFL